MAIYSSTITDIISNRMAQPYYRCDGVDDNIVSSSTTNIVANTDFAVHVVCRTPTGTGGASVILATKTYSWNTSSGFMIGTENAQVGDGSAYQNFDYSNMPTGEWTDIIVTFDYGSNAFTVYVNGIQWYTASLTVGYANDTNNLTFGSWANTSQGIGNVEISSCEIYNFLPSATERKDMISGNPVPFKYKGASQTNQLPHTGFVSASDTSPGTGWTQDTDADYSSASSGGHNDTAILTIERVADTTQYAYTYPNMDGGSVPAVTLIPGKKYRASAWVKSGTAGDVSAVLNIYNASWGTYAEGQPDAITSSSSWQEMSLEFIATGGTDGIFLLRSYITTGSGTQLWSDPKIVPLGASVEYDGSGIASDKWFDKSGNDLHGTVSGATVENAPSDDSGLVYEEGTMTPTILLGGTEISTNSGTYNTAQTMGSYTRIGNRVLFNMRVGITAKGNETGAIRVAGLPYTPASSPNAVSAASLTMWVVSYADTPFANIDEGSTSVGLFETTNAGTYTTLTEGNIGGTAFIQVAGQYHI